VRPSGQRVEADFWVCHDDVGNAPPIDRPYLPEHSAVTTDGDVTVHYASEQTALVTTRGGRTWWQPTDWSEPFNQFLPKYQLGSTYPAFLVASLLSQQAATRRKSHVVGIARPAPVAFHLWRSNGAVHILLGNLETGELGDSRVSRHVRIRLSHDELSLPDGPLALRLIDGWGPDVTPAEQVEPGLFEAGLTLPAESAAVYVVERIEQGVT
jgi:hypothetical protein